MALVPVQFIQEAHNPAASSLSLTVVAGTTMVVFGGCGGSNLDTTVLTGVSDTQGNSYTRWINSGQLQGGPAGPGFSGPLTTSVWTATMSASGTVTVTITGSATPSGNPQFRLVLGNFRNVGGVVGSGLQTSGSTAGNFNGPNQVSPVNNAMYYEAWTYSNVAFGNPLPLSWFQISPANSPSIPTFDNFVGALGTTPNILNGQNNGTLGTFFGVWAGQIIMSSASATDPDNGNVFLGTANLPMFGMPWMKNVSMLARPNWDAGLLYADQGQLYPLPNTGNSASGRTYPY